MDGVKRFFGEHAASADLVNSAAELSVSCYMERGHMFNFPETEKKLKSRISSYKSALNKEKKTYGYINDGGGKRYLLFSLYFVLNDLKKSENYFEWYATEFSDDVGEPIQKLCWALSLHRMGKVKEAKLKLAELMLSNLYIIPKIINKKVKEYDIWHSSSDADIDYIDYLPQEVRTSIQQSEVDWMKTLYESLEFQRIRKRYIEIFHELQNVKEIGARRVLLDESYTLLNQLAEEGS